VKKIEGNIAQLREDLKVALGIEEDREIQVNHLTRHIIVKVCLKRCCCSFPCSVAEGGRKGCFELVVWSMANYFDRDTANRRLPSFWKSTSFREGQSEEGGDERVRGRRTVLEKWSVYYKGITGSLPAQTCTKRRGKPI
jgi:hypothetical protein